MNTQEAVSPVKYNFAAIQSLVTQAKSYALQGYTPEAISNMTGLSIDKLNHILREKVELDDVSGDIAKVYALDDCYLDVMRKIAVRRSDQTATIAANTQLLRQRLVAKALAHVSGGGATFAEIVTALKVVGVPKATETDGISGYENPTRTPKTIVDHNGNITLNPEYSSNTNTVNVGIAQTVDITVVRKVLASEGSQPTIILNENNEAVGVRTNGSDSNTVTADLSTLRNIAGASPRPVLTADQKDDILSILDDI